MDVLQNSANQDQPTFDRALRRLLLENNIVSLSTATHDVYDGVSVASSFKMIDAHVETVLDGGVSKMLRRFYAYSTYEWDTSGAWHACYLESISDVTDATKPAISP